MKWMRKGYITASVLALGGTLLLGGCAKGDPPPGESGTANQNAPAGANTLPGGGQAKKDGKFDPPVTITTGAWIGGDTKFVNGDSIENTPIIRWARDNMGIDLKYAWIVAKQGETLENKIKLSLSSGERLPDILNFGDKVLLKDLVEAGKIQPVDDMFDKYASDRLKKLYADNADVWNSVTIDGKRYGIPFIWTHQFDNILWIRTDWLKKVGMEAPKTIDDLEKVMDAFVTQDPDGNGKKDTIGLAVAGKDSLMDWMASTDWVFGAYGNDIPGIWSKAADGSLQYASIQPSVKQGLAKLHDWYEKGYLAQDLSLNDAYKAAEWWQKGKAGLIAGPAWMGGWPLQDVTVNVKGATYEPIPLPAGPGGQTARRSTAGANGFMVFGKEFNQYEAFFDYFDVIYGPAFLDPDSPFKYGYQEDYDYKLQDGKLLPKDQLPGKNAPIPIVGGVSPGQYSNEDLVQKALSGDVSTPYLQSRAQDPKPVLQGLVINDGLIGKSMPNHFTGASTKTMSSKAELLDKSEKETFIKIVYGKTPIDDFDRFVQEWKAGGGDEITKEVNDWWTSVGGQ
ncbi:extracellular solute-binding protein [Paenibacillus sp. GCM10023250]|uniref:extracellular solute-binding protein n=1 Tax=Paenibacillus sp. GCM10023250 TaxID=3252648 RepID=UPI00360FE603